MTPRWTMLASAAAATLLAAPSAWADILIATAGPMKGQYAVFGEQLQRGAEMAVKTLNANGGVLGQQVKLEIADDGCDARKAAALAKELAAKGAVFVAGHFCSIASISAAPVYAAAGVVMISPASSQPKFTVDGQWNTHRLAPPDDAQGTFAGQRLARDFAGRKVMILYDRTPLSASLALRSKVAMNAAGLNEIGLTAFDTGKTDFAEMAGRVKALSPDALYIAGPPGDAAALMRLLKEQGVNLKLYGTDALATQDFWTAADSAGEGALVSFPADAMALDAAKEALAAYAALGITPEGYTLQTQAAVEMWAAAARATGATEGHKIADWLKAGNRVKTVIGEIALDAKGDLINPPFVWLKWTNGQIGLAP